MRQSEDIIRDDEDGDDVEMPDAPEVEEAGAVTPAPATTHKKTSVKKSATVSALISPNPLLLLLIQTFSAHLHNH